MPWARDDFLVALNEATRLGADGELCGHVLRALRARAARSSALAASLPDLARATLTRWEGRDASLAAPVVGTALSLLREGGESVVAHRERLIARLVFEEGEKERRFRLDQAVTEEAERVEDLRRAGRPRDAIEAAGALRVTSSDGTSSRHVNAAAARAYVSAGHACLDAGGRGAADLARGWARRANRVASGAYADWEDWLEDVTRGEAARLTRRLAEQAAAR